MTAAGQAVQFTDGGYFTCHLLKQTLLLELHYWCAAVFNLEVVTAAEFGGRVDGEPELRESLIDLNLMWTPSAWLSSFKTM